VEGHGFSQPSRRARLLETFTTTFVNDTLFGNLFEQADLSAPPTAVPFTQNLEVTGGAGAFLWYNGRLTGSGTSNFVTSIGSNSGSGTLNTTPEAVSAALLPIGFMCLLAYRRYRPGSSKTQTGRRKDRHH
jgi:hypothetical protein